MRISSYHFGKMTVDGETRSRDVIVHPGRAEGPWWRREGILFARTISRPSGGRAPTCSSSAPGSTGAWWCREAVAYARARGVEVRSAPTAEAVDLFNRLEPGTVVGAFHLTC